MVDGWDGVEVEEGEGFGSRDGVDVGLLGWEW